MRIHVVWLVVAAGLSACKEPTPCDDSFDCPILSFCSTESGGGTCSDGTCTQDIECGTNGVCDRSGGAPVCRCLPGNSVYRAAKVCVPGGGCLDLSCGALERCSDASGVAECVCVPGAERVGERCEWDDPCDPNPCPASTACTGQPGQSAVCKCPTGYALVDDACLDVDECASTLPPCDGGRCVNGVGGFTCQCPPGLASDGSRCVDVDECAAPDTCGPNSTCTNRVGYYDCGCVAGFHDAGSGCADIDECASGLVGCAPNGSCRNTPGSFGCVCNNGFVGDGSFCTAKAFRALVDFESGVVASRADGTLWSWGQVQFAGPSAALFPRVLDLTHDWTVRAATDAAICVTSGAALTCWGQLDRSRTSGEALVKSDGPWISVALGRSGTQSCAVNEAGTLVCWGNRATSFAGLDATGNPVNAQYANEPFERPIVYSIRDGWRRVTTGRGERRCAVGRGGEMHCWGFNVRGELGTDDTATTVRSPSRVGAATDWFDVATGSDFTCGLRSGGTLWCWGRGLPGDRAASTSQPLRTTPVQVVVPRPLAALGTPIGDGQRNLCALDQDGGIWCFGDNWNGELGTNDDVPSAVPVRVALEGRFVSIGGRCAVTAEGRAACWGPRGMGAMADGEADFVRSPVRIGQEASWDRAVVGELVSLATRRDGSLWSWGAAGLALGRSSTSGAGIPGIVLPASGWSSPANVGTEASCALRSGELWCWGDNSRGAVGDGTRVDRPTPVRIGDASDWTWVRGFRAGVVAGKSSGAVYGWSSMQLPVPDTGAGLEPTLLAGGAAFSDAACTGTGSDALDCVGVGSAGGLWRWIGTSVPVQLGTGSWRSPDRVASMGCAVTFGGNVRCWEMFEAVVREMTGMPAGPWRQWSIGGALGSFGVRLGDGVLSRAGSFDDPLTGERTNDSPAVRFGEGAGWQQVSVGYRLGCGTRADGSLWCWGSDNNGGLGTGQRMSPPKWIEL